MPLLISPRSRRRYSSPRPPRVSGEIERDKAMEDPFALDCDAFELKIAAEFLRKWLPFLARDFCRHCRRTLTDGIRSLHPDSRRRDSDLVQPLANQSLNADSRKKRSRSAEAEELSLTNDKEYDRFMNVGRKKDFICLEKIRGRNINILEGLELHTRVFNAAEQEVIVDYVYMLQEMGKKGQFKERTYSEPAKWMRGKGRVTIQFGCCYNYATDKKGNPPGILHREVVDPIPSLFKVIIRRLVGWHVLPSSCVPDSCIVNIYEKGDCIPPHIDNHDFIRPFCTISFLSECNILFGSHFNIKGPGEFSGSAAISLPVGSVLVLNGNGADVAKHCVPAVPTKRISITFRKMDDRKRPRGFVPEPDLQGIRALPCGQKRQKRD